MNRHTIFADIAGRTSKGIEGNARVTAAAVAVPTGEVASLRRQLRSGLPKWGRCKAADAEAVSELLAVKAVAVAAVSMNKDTQAWRQFIVDEAILHSEIASESKRAAGWAKASVILTFELLSRVCFMATAHAIKVGPKRRLLDAQGLELIESSIVCDSELSGEENIEVFKSFWREEHIPRESLARMGLRIVHPEVQFSTEQAEPLLLLADYAAGLVHSAHLPNPGRLAMPLACAEASALLHRVELTGKLLVEALDFDTSYEGVFGHAMHEARQRHDG